MLTKLLPGGPLVCPHRRHELQISRRRVHLAKGLFTPGGARHRANGIRPLLGATDAPPAWGTIGIARAAVRDLRDGTGRVTRLFGDRQALAVAAEVRDDDPSGRPRRARREPPRATASRATRCTSSRRRWAWALRRRSTS